MKNSTHNSQVNISVAVVFYNADNEELQLTKENIHKLLSLSDFNFQFYLIDNGSPVKKINKKIFQNIDSSCIHFMDLPKNVGFGQGHNSILPCLNSNYHLIMNPDIHLNNMSGFREAIAYLEQNKQVVLLSPLVRNSNTGEIQYLNRNLPTVFDLAIRFLGDWAFPKRQERFTRSSYGYDHVQAEDNATGSFMILRTPAFKKVHGFDPRFFMYFEDTDLTVRLNRIGKVVIYPKLTVYHGWQRANHSIKGISPMLKSMVKYFNKWGWQWF